MTAALMGSASWVNMRIPIWSFGSGVGCAIFFLVSKAVSSSGFSGSFVGPMVVAGNERQGGSEGGSDNPGYGSDEWTEPRFENVHVPGLKSYV